MARRLNIRLCKAAYDKLYSGEVKYGAVKRKILSAIELDKIKHMKLNECELADYAPTNNLSTSIRIDDELLGFYEYVNKKLTGKKISIIKIINKAIVEEV